MGSVAVHSKTEAVGEHQRCRAPFQLRGRRFLVTLELDTHTILYVGERLIRRMWCVHDTFCLLLWSHLMPLMCPITLIFWWIFKNVSVASMLMFSSMSPEAKRPDIFQTGQKQPNNRTAASSGEPLKLFHPLLPLLIQLSALSVRNNMD